MESTAQEGQKQAGFISGRYRPSLRPASTSFTYHLPGGLRDNVQLMGSALSTHWHRQVYPRRSCSGDREWWLHCCSMVNGQVSTPYCDFKLKPTSCSVCWIILYPRKYQMPTTRWRIIHCLLPILSAALDLFPDVEFSLLRLTTRAKWGRFYCFWASCRP